MARSAAIPLAFGGIASILIISGIQGESIAEVLKGEFGSEKGKPFPNPAYKGEDTIQPHSPEPEPTVVGPTTKASNHAILTHAASMLGVKYLWGGESEKNGFDCSGLTQWAYAQSGIHIPRTAQAQYDYMRHTTTPQPGDLVFFGSSTRGVSHVGIVIQNGVMLDAPHTGEVIKYQHFNPTIGSKYGNDKLIGYGQA